jgi:preprotein translocase subunit SecA
MPAWNLHARMEPTCLHGTYMPAWSIHACMEYTCPAGKRCLNFSTECKMKAIKKIKTFLHRLKQTTVTDDVQPYESLLQQTLQLAESMRVKTDADLRQMTDIIKNKILSGESPDVHMAELYSIIAEVFRRTLHMTPYRVQIMAAIALHQRTIIEMQTGEGKTLVAVFTACLNALSAKGVHVLTFNDYLAKRDANWMRPVYEFLGLSVGYIQENMPAADKRIAYRCDITYGTAKEVGFDYLRSCMAYEPGEIMLRDFNYAIVDEADAILIDEARNPLVFAGNIEGQPVDHHQIARYVARLTPYRDFMLDEYARNVFLTDQGIGKTEQFFSVQNLYDDHHQELLIAVNLALQARSMLRKDVDYIIEEGRIKLVDEFTGRIVEDRKWQNGLQAAVEAKEGLAVQSEGRILNSISLQHLMNCYPKVSGMTGTAQHAAEEFASLYGLGVTVIPSHKPCRRIDHPDMIFTHKAAKVKAIIEEVTKIHQTGRPILIGTLTVKESEELQAEMQRHGIACTVLNAKNNESEAAIIEQAGMPGAITISTNMAGRGTDIMLGGREQRSKEAIVASGGLHIIGTNRHESLRIDHQLKGRAGRQGDPGSSQFIISMEDDLMVKYGLKSLLPEHLRNLRYDGPIHHATIARSIAQAQRIIEGQLHEIRMNLHQYSHFIEKQRTILFDRRQDLFFSEEGRLKEYKLFQHDFLWSYYMNDIAALREGIHWQRMAGRNPLQEFYKSSDAMFRQLMEDLEDKLSHAGSIDVAELKVKRPSSTWTYLVNDNPFKNPLALMLGNIGYQVDLLAGPLMMIMKMFGWLKRKDQ